MEDTVVVGSSAVSPSTNHACNNEVSHDNTLLCNDKTATEATTSGEIPPADVSAGAEPIDSVVSETCSADAEAASARDVSASNTDSGHLDTEQRSVNGNGTTQQSDDEKTVDVNSTAANHELELATSQAKQKFGAFHQLDRPASVVIDLRTPRLVQVCLLHGVDDIGASGSGSSSTRVHRRPQTARRGRRFQSGVMDRTSRASNVGGSSLTFHARDHDMLSSDADVHSNQLENNDKKSRSKDKTSSAELSTIIHLKVVDTPADVTRSEQSEFSPVADDAVSDSRIRLRRHRDGDHTSESSDDDTMRVRSVNRTYTRTPSVPAARKNPQPAQITGAKTTDSRGGKKGSEVSSDVGTRTTSQHHQGFKSVPKKLARNGKWQTRIGPAWFSRKSLSAPPPEIWKCARTSKELKTIKRPNYNSGVRRLPIVAVPPIVKRVLDVPVSEEADIATVGREELKLWRLSEEDVEELKSQLRQEAEHRRSEHIMPLVMQMTDAQIEYAYEHIAESMKTYEIVEADSDEDEMVEDEESEEEGEEVAADDYKNSDDLRSPDWNSHDETGAEKFGETEYSRMRPKRHAVDYGPSAFAPILIMEGRRMFSRQPKSSRPSQIQSADTPDRVKLHQDSDGHRSRGRRRRKGKLAGQLDELPADTPAEKSTNNMDDNAGFFCF